MIVLSYPKDQLKSVISALDPLLSAIKGQTGQIFVPVVLQQIPLQANTDFLLILRHIERLDKLKLDTDSILDEAKLPKQFEIRTFKVPKTAATAGEAGASGSDIAKLMHDELQ